MYSEAVVAARVRALERSSMADALPGRKLVEYPVDECHTRARLLQAIWNPQKREPTRPFSVEEQTFVANERLRVKLDYRYWAERYCWIQSEGQTLKPMFPLWESQALILQAIAQIEEDRLRRRHPDGILVNILKGRQLGASTLSQSLLAHRVTTHSYVKTLIASDVPENSGSQGLFGMLERVVEHLPWWLKPAESFHTKNQHIVFRNGSSVLVESGKSMKGALKEEGGSKGQLGRSKTFSAVHLSELSTWEYPQQIDDSLLPAVPRTPRTLLIGESTAKGRHNWWHQHWLVAMEGRGRFANIFIPWYAEASRYRLPPPAEWIPTDDTLSFARRVQEKGERWMGRVPVLSKEQLYWYEDTKAVAIRKGQLSKFLEEYPAEPEEAFQHSGRSIFTPEVLDRLEAQARPLVDIWTIRPYGELLRDRDALRAELSAQQAADQQRIAEERARGGARVLTAGGAGQIVKEDLTPREDPAPDPVVETPEPPSHTRVEILR